MSAPGDALGEREIDFLPPPLSQCLSTALNSISGLLLSLSVLDKQSQRRHAVTLFMDVNLFRSVKGVD